MGSRVRKVWRGFGARGCLGLSESAHVRDFGDYEV